jgi:mannose-6-phosphate isomerase-like protein (cupin superfamily)
MKPSIRRFSPEKEYYFDEGCYILESLNLPDDPAASIARARVPSGVTTKLHRLRGVVERYFILEGTGVVEVGDLGKQQVRSGDVVFIPPLCTQRITNTCPGDLIFLAICTPRFTRESYEDLEIPVAT